MHTANGIKIAIALSGRHALPIPQASGLRAHFKYNRFLISKK
jgi:hypothetical protein